DNRMNRVMRCIYRASIRSPGQQVRQYRAYFKELGVDRMHSRLAAHRSKMARHSVDMLAEFRSEGACRLALELAVATAMLCWAAIFNQSPFGGYDTGYHLLTGGTGRLFWVHSPFYSYFVFGVGGGWSLWTVAIAQGLIGAILIRFALRSI